MLVPNLPVLNRAKKEGRSRTEGLPERAVVAAQKGDWMGEGGWEGHKRIKNRIMQVKIFTLCVEGDEKGEGVLNRFLRSTRIFT